MPISLTELVKDLAQAATAMDEVTRASSVMSLDGECDVDESGYRRPRTTKIKLPSGETMDMPTATLKDHSGLAAEKLKLTVSTDAILEGRALKTRPPQSFSATKGTSASSNHQNRREGFLIYGPGQFGALPLKDTLVLNDVACKLQAFFYMPNAGLCQVRCETGTDLTQFVGVQLRVWNPNGPGETIFELGDAQRSGSSDRLYLTWHNYDDMEWFKDLESGATFDMEFVDVAHNRKVESLVGQRGYCIGDTYFDIMVTFTEGLGESTSKLSIEADFTRQPPPEGVALAVDRLNNGVRAKMT